MKRVGQWAQGGKVAIYALSKKRVKEDRFAEILHVS